MVTAAAGSVALVVGPLVKEHGVQYLLPAVVLAGLDPDRCSGSAASHG